jgi:hypothetical protein
MILHLGVGYGMVKYVKSINIWFYVIYGIISYHVYTQL